MQEYGNENIKTLHPMSINCIENLSNEIFYEIFEYLDALKLFEAFSYLNIRFENLLYYSSFVLKYINDNNLLECQFKDHYTQFLIRNKHRLYSLHLNHRLVIERFFTFCNVDSSFKRLESLVLNQIESHQLQQLLSKIIVLPCLFSLSTQLDNDNVDISNIYRFIFQNEQFSPIEYLNLEHSVTRDTLISLLSYTPRLRRLTCKQLFPSNENSASDILITSANLTHISIQICHLRFDQFERFITQICSQLQVLHINTSKSLTYLHANRWEQLIVEHLPQLRKFNLEYQEPLHSYFLNRPNRPPINRFISSFWIERRWMFELKINTSEISYSIHPYKPIWSNFHKQKEIDYNSIRPTITTNFSGEWNQSSLDIIIRGFFPSIQITYLNIDCSQVDLLTFIKLLHYLPDLNTLKLSSSSSLLSTYLYAKTSGIINAISNKNNIIKVNINKIIDIRETQLIIDLCPRMIYWEIDGINEIDPVLLLRFILTKQINNCIPYLGILRLHNETLNNDIVDKLRRMINLEKLLIDYAIDCIGDTINLYSKPQFVLNKLTFKKI